jgi:hypothetical protein
MFDCGDACSSPRFASRLAPTRGASRSPPAGVCLCGSWPASDFWRVGMPVHRHDSPAGWLLQRQQTVHRQRAFVFVGAGLPAIFGARECPLSATIRQQAGSYKGSKPFIASGRLSLWELACQRMFACGTARSSPRFSSRLAPTRGANRSSPAGICLCGSRPASDFWRAGMPVERHDSPAGWLLQGEQTVHRQRAFVFVGAGLPANVCLRYCPFFATILQQAGSYKGRQSDRLPLELTGLLGQLRDACPIARGHGIGRREPGAAHADHVGQGQKLGRVGR